MEHATYEEACRITNDLREACDSVHRVGYVHLTDEHGEKIPWLGTTTKVDGAWNKLCITTKAAWESGKIHTDGPTADGPGPWVTLVCDFPEGSIKNNLPPTYRRVADCRIPT
jgi:hypothetical protein